MFEVGDWVRYIEDDVITRVDSEGFCQALNNKYNDDYELWQPQEGEWCWFWNSFEEPILGCLYETDIYEGEANKYNAKSIYDKHSMYDYCEPFIGELPSFIKEKQ